MVPKGDSGTADPTADTLKPAACDPVIPCAGLLEEAAGAGIHACTVEAGETTVINLPLTPQRNHPKNIIFIQLLILKCLAARRCETD